MYNAGEDGVGGGWVHSSLKHFLLHLICINLGGEPFSRTIAPILS